MRKIIHSRFAAKCRTCKGSIAAGERIYWFGKGAGVQHISCVESPTSDEPKPVKQAEYTYTEDFHSLRAKFQRVSSGDFTYLKRQVNRDRMASLLKGWKQDSSFYGCTLSEMNTWLTEGFTVEGLAGIDSSLFAAKPRPYMIFDEEGDEMLFDLAMAGIEEHFISWEERTTKPGLKVDINLCFNADFNADLIVQYERWLARMLHSIEEAGIDCEINLTNTGTHTFSSDKSEKKNECRVRVKNAGEASDFASWSAMFSPGGFRMLSFACIVHSADFHGHDVSIGLGRAVYGSKWSVEYDEESNTLSIGNPGNIREFPEFEMTEQFRAILERIA